MTRTARRRPRNDRSSPRLFLIAGTLAALALAGGASATPAEGDQRPARLLAERPDGTLLLAPIRWGYQPSPERPLGDPAKPVFWLTALKPSDVTEAYFCVQRFDPDPAKLRFLGDRLARRVARTLGDLSTGHGMLYFKLRDGSVRSVGSLPGDPPERTRSASDLWLSTEAATGGRPYSFLTGLRPLERGGFGVVNLLTPGPDRDQKTCALDVCRVDRYRLKLSDAQVRSLLDESLRAALSFDPKESYHTLRNNCATVPMGMIARVTGRRFGPGAAIPARAVGELVRAGLVDPRPSSSLAPPPGASREPVRSPRR